MMGLALEIRNDLLFTQDMSQRGWLTVELGLGGGEPFLRFRSHGPLSLYEFEQRLRDAEWKLQEREMPML